MVVCPNVSFSKFIVGNQENSMKTILCMCVCVWGCLENLLDKVLFVCFPSDENIEAGTLAHRESMCAPPS